jgi:hypothetical protein
MKGNLVGPEDAEDSDVEMAPDDQELNYGERQYPGVGTDTMAVFNHHHAINSVQVNFFTCPSTVSFCVVVTCLLCFLKNSSQFCLAVSFLCLNSLCLLLLCVHVRDTGISYIFLAVLDGLIKSYILFSH